MVVATGSCYCGSCYWCNYSCCTRGGCHRLQFALEVLSSYHHPYNHPSVRYFKGWCACVIPKTVWSRDYYLALQDIIARCVWSTCRGSMAEGTPTKIQIPLDSQSIVLPVSEIISCTSRLTTCSDGVRVFHQQGEERIHVSHLSPDGKLLEYPFEDAKTLYEAFLRGMRVSSMSL